MKRGTLHTVATVNRKEVLKAKPPHFQDGKTSRVAGFATSCWFVTNIVNTREVLDSSLCPIRSDQAGW